MVCGFFPRGGMLYERITYGITVLVPDRQSFAARFPQIVLERADIETYMSLMLKGEAR